MNKIYIPFESWTSKKEYLTYELYDHSLAEKWRSLILKTQVMGGEFLREDIFFGKGFYSLEELDFKIRETLEELSESYPDIWKDAVFKDLLIRSLNNEFLNLAHLLFERVHAYLTKDLNIPIPEDKYEARKLQKLNSNIHKAEALLSNEEGFFIDTSYSAGSIKRPIDSSEVKLFSLDRKWGELYLSYCHIGESYLEVFNNKHLSIPVPQTEISGAVILDFRPDRIFEQHTELEEWLRNHLGINTGLGDLPLGNVPLGKICGEWNSQTINDFFKMYPFMGKKIKLD